MAFQNFKIYFRTFKTPKIRELSWTFANVRERSHFEQLKYQYCISIKKLILKEKIIKLKYFYLKKINKKWVRTFPAKSIFGHGLSRDIGFFTRVFLCFPDFSPENSGQKGCYIACDITVYACIKKVIFKNANKK